MANTNALPNLNQKIVRFLAEIMTQANPETQNAINAQITIHEIITLLTETDPEEFFRKFSSILSKLSNITHKNYNALSIFHEDDDIENEVNVVPTTVSSMTPSQRPMNYRTIPYQINGKNISISGMAKPTWNNRSAQSVIRYLHEHGYGSIISLHPHHDEKLFAESLGITYINEAITDFTAPSIEQFERIYHHVEVQSQYDERIAIHCGEGFGRTGTVLAALKIKEYLLKHPQHSHQISDKTDSIQLGRHGNYKNIPCTPLVKNIVEHIRSEPESAQSVETESQILQLCAYENFIKQHLNPSLALPDETELPSLDEEMDETIFPVETNPIRAQFIGLVKLFTKNNPEQENNILTQSLFHFNQFLAKDTETQARIENAMKIFMTKLEDVLTTRPDLKERFEPDSLPIILKTFIQTGDHEEALQNTLHHAIDELKQALEEDDDFSFDA